eukprot:scaffold15051_cov32-Tisochrysis_lutea.AAC.1
MPAGHHFERFVGPSSGRGLTPTHPASGPCPASRPLLANPATSACSGGVPLQPPSQGGMDPQQPRARRCAKEAPVLHQCCRVRARAEPAASCRSVRRGAAVHGFV